MFQKGLLWLVGFVFLVVAVPAFADWQPGDPYKMHFPQLPDEQGWDVNASAPVVLADDWQCTETGPVTDIHFWGSWRDVTGDGVGDVGNIVSFIVRIYPDVPDPDGTGPLFSHPDYQPLWVQEVSQFVVVPIDPPTLEAWYDPSKEPDVVVPNDHDAYFQYNMFLDQMSLPLFEQIAGTVYWLSISAVIQPEAVPKEWGWKSTINHFNDDAVWSLEPPMAWTEIVEPPRVNLFTGGMDPFGNFAGGSGTNAYGAGWYFYEPTGWWNIWFYDNPFTYEHYKAGMIQGQIVPIDPLQPVNVTVAVNWSTAAWSQQVPPPEGPPIPPCDEGLFIGRHVIYNYVGMLGPGGEPLYAPFEILDYNPEWVSVDIMGTNFMIVNGRISHECVRTSLDLAFVITGHAATGACCFPDGNCAVMTQAACLATPGNNYAGDGTTCLGDLNYNGVDDACEQFVPTGACCYPTGACAVVGQVFCVNNGGFYMGDGSSCLGDFDMNGIDDACEHVIPTGACCWPDGSCSVVGQAYCLNGGGVYMGDGSPCLGDGNQNGVDDACETVVPSGACCFDNGSCQVLMATLCAQQGGTYAGDGTSCLGDANQNSIDDACEGVVQLGACCYGNPASPSCVNTTGTICTQQYSGTWYTGQDCATFVCPVSGKWEQRPDLTETGVDVYASMPLVLADDFICTLTGQIVQIEIWGSWWHDQLPNGDPTAVAFTLSLHRDIPDPDGPLGPLFSMPGAPICVIRFEPGQFAVEPAPVIAPEGWYNPATQSYEFPGDQNCFKYIFHIDDPCWVQQEGTIYWLDVQAQPMGMIESFFGWKTSLSHWNDDAVWGMGEEPMPGPWTELRYPPGHPMAGQSIDLAFALTSVPLHTGACCYTDQSCVVLTEAACTASQGNYMGDGTDCSDADGDGVADECESCCVGRVGNANGVGGDDPTIGDISIMIDALFITASETVLRTPPACLDEADCNLSALSPPTPHWPPVFDDITIGDISALIDALFITADLSILPNCP